MRHGRLTMSIDAQFRISGLKFLMAAQVHTKSDKNPSLNGVK